MDINDQLNTRFTIRILVSGILILLLALTAVAAEPDTLWLNLNDCLGQALSSSPSARSAYFDSVAAAGQWRVAWGKQFPQLRLSGQVPTWGKSVNYDVRYNTDTQTDTYTKILSENQIWTGTLDINQNLPWGATLNLSSSLYKIRYLTGLGDTTININEYSWRQRALISQPLLEGNPVGREKRIAKIEWYNGLLSNETQLRAIRYNTINQFFGLVSAYGQLEISKQDYEQGVSSVQLAERKYNAGLVPEVDLLQIKVDVARRENSLKQAQAFVEGAMDDLRMELGLSFERPIAPLYDITSTSLGSIDSINVSGESLELIREKMYLERTELETRSQILTKRIQATLDLYYEVDSRQDSFEKLSTQGDQNYGVTLHIELPIFGFGSTNGAVQTLKANLERQRIGYQIRSAQLAAELRTALRNARLAAERIRIADAALDLALKSFAITNSRFDTGLINSRELIDAHLELTRTRKEALSARIDYELSLAYLERIAPMDISKLGIKY